MGQGWVGCLYLNLLKIWGYKGRKLVCCVSGSSGVGGWWYWADVVHPLFFTSADILLVIESSRCHISLSFFLGLLCERSFPRSSALVFILTYMRRPPAPPSNRNLPILFAYTYILSDALVTTLPSKLISPSSFMHHHQHHQHHSLTATLPSTSTYRRVFPPLVLLAGSLSFPILDVS